MSSTLTSGISKQHNHLANQLIPLSTMRVTGLYSAVPSDYARLNVLDRAVGAAEPAPDNLRLANASSWVPSVESEGAVMRGLQQAANDGVGVVRPAGVL